MSDQDLIALNLDEYEREKTYTDFRFVYRERVMVMTDPADMDWQFLEELDRDSSIIIEAMTEEDRTFFLKQKTPAWKMQKLALDYQNHYGVGDSSTKKG